MGASSANSIILSARTHEIDLAVFDEGFLSRTVERRMTVTGMACVPDYCAYLKASRTEAETLASSLLISYSLFFREPFVYALMEQFIIPGLLSRVPENGELRVWSSGCAGGQEAYSLAILLDEQIQASRKPLRYRIFATDISEEALETAKKGVYGADDVRNVMRRHLNGYFSPSGEKYAVSPRIRENILFSRYDLLDEAHASPPESIFGHFDIVSCSNLLLYYQPDARTRILRKLEKSFTQDGYLIVGETERTFVQKHTNLHMLFVPSAIFQKAPGAGACEGVRISARAQGGIAG